MKDVYCPYCDGRLAVEIIKSICASLSEDGEDVVVGNDSWGSVITKYVSVYCLECNKVEAVRNRSLKRAVEAMYEKAKK